MTRVRVPLAVDTQVRIPVGPALLPLRAVALLAAVSPAAYLALQLQPIDASYRIGVALSLLMIALAVAVPQREGVWIGTWCAYRAVRPLLPTALVSGSPRRATVREVAGGIEVTRVRLMHRPLGRLPLTAPLVTVPAVSTVAPGVIHLQPGGARAVLLLDGPVGSLTGDGYAAWSARTVQWLLAIDCPAQLVTVLSHHDSHRAQTVFDEATVSWPPTPLLDLERTLVGAVAEQSVAFRHYVVLSPSSAGPDGIPYGSVGWRSPRRKEASESEASRLLRLALRLAPGAGVAVSMPDRDDVATLVRQSVLGLHDAATTVEGILHGGDEEYTVLTITTLPPVVQTGMVVDALMRGRAQGTASLHITNVAPTVARKALDRRLSMQRYSAREGNTGVDNEVAAADTSHTLAALARRDIQPCRVALTLLIAASGRSTAMECAERVAGLLDAQGFGVVRPTSPGLLPALAAAPGMPPLRRSLQLTSDGVAACLLPALGTPFLDVRQPLIGISENTGAPAHLSVWTRPNHNAIVVGSSGAGKSVSAKTLLVRHVMQGASAVVVDPDSEYRRVMHALGGRHLELGEDALNPLAPAAEVAPDTAAGLVLPVLSVMAGDEKGVRDGRPIRRLPDEDLGWLHREMAAYFSGFTKSGTAAEPLLSGLLTFLETEAVERALTVRELERCRVITARLRRFTQGDHARVFDRPSTFRVGATPIAIGLRDLSLAYASDLTPALAVVLTAVLAALRRREDRFIVVVDEAHRVTCDPDAGDVLGRLVRQARKYGAGVWMCSQRVDDFVSTDLGRTLASTAATKVVLGVEEAALAGLRETFALNEEETAAINPPVTGRAILVSGSERTVVRILPGAGILAVADSRPVLQPANVAGAA